MAGDAQHPHEPGGDRAAGVVVGDDRVVVADAEPAIAARERLGVGQRMAAASRRGRRGQERSRSTKTAPGRWPAS